MVILSACSPVMCSAAHALRRASRIGVLGGSMLFVLAPTMAAQGVATAAIRGTVRAEDDAPVDGARVRVVNRGSGVAWTTNVRYGRFLVQGLDAGSTYMVEVQLIGYMPQRSDTVAIRLGEPAEVEFVMRRLVRGLDTVHVRAWHGGTNGAATLISDSLIHRLPTLNRNFYDFVVLAPQVSSKVGFQRSGLTGAGANFRFNSFLINGADERFVNGNVSAGTNAGKSVPLDAVKEYQVLVAPYDVRYGDFAGALINTVTHSGTNRLHGSVFSYWRNDRLGRTGELAPGSPYDQLQYGLSLGGPVVRDRVHFFLAQELQHRSSPAPGPYAGQPASRAPGVPVSDDDLARLAAAMRGHGLAPGSAGPVEVRSPLRNTFARLDAAIPRWNSRAVGFVSYSAAETEQFSRTATDTFYLSNYRFANASSLRLISLQLHSALPGTAGGHNELIVSHVADRVEQIPDVRQPLVRVLVPGEVGGFVMLNSGTAEQAQGRSRRSGSFAIRNDFSLPVGARHLLLVGAQAERFATRARGVRGGYGVWTFASLDALEQGLPERYEFRKEYEGARTPLRGGQYAAYIGDNWQPGDRLSLTMGVRADLMTFSSQAPYNPTVDSIFGRRTDVMPRPRIHLSPRVGFTWLLPGELRDRLRGGVGIFTGRPPRAWLGPAVSSYGVGVGVLRCGNRPSDAGLPPAFVPDLSAAPTECATGPALEYAPLGEVDLLDRSLRMAQSLRASLAYDRRLPWDIVATVEVLGSRHLSDFIFVNLNLEGAQGVDAFGRVLYGTIDPSGVARPALRSGFAEVIDLRNTSKNSSHQISTRLEKRFTRGTAAILSYTNSRTRDVQSPSRVNMPGINLWADARALSGRHEELRRAVSLNDLPHRVVAALTYTAPWRRRPTSLSFYYVGESGSPFTYLAGGIDRRGDLNADGSNANDPVYIPRDVFDEREILFNGQSNAPGADNSPAAQAERILAQQRALDRFIERSHCLRRQRGAILARNSCREPWSHMTIAAVRQVIPLGGHVLEGELDLFNVLNLLNDDWGHYRVASPRLLEHVEHTVGPSELAQPVFRFDTTRSDWTILPTESAFQLQFALRYRF